MPTSRFIFSLTHLGMFFLKEPLLCGYFLQAEKPIAKNIATFNY